jgi:hypothetical protein
MSNNNQYPPYPVDEGTYSPQNQLHTPPQNPIYNAPLAQAEVGHSAWSQPQTSPNLAHTFPPEDSHDSRLIYESGKTRPDGSGKGKSRWVNEKWQRRLYWLALPRTSAAQARRASIC